MVNTVSGTKKDRNAIVRKNVLLSALLKVIGLSTSLLIVPITLHYLDNEVYGIWMTMTSILYWFAFLDIGLGNGMRNYLTAAISTADYEKAHSVIVTTFVLLFFIAIVIGVFVAAILYNVDLNKIFNTSAVSAVELRNIMLVACTFTLALFVVKNIGLIFVAMQKYAINDLLGVSGQVVALIVIYILTKTTDGSLFYVVSVFTAIPVTVFIIAAFPLFIRNKRLRPSLKEIDLGMAYDVVVKGLGFFVIQITSCVVIFGCANVFIAHFCGPASVTTYNIAYKYFNILAIAYTVILAPMWNAYTDAYVKGDMTWIRSNFSKAQKLWAASVCGGTLMLLCSNFFYHLWVGESVDVPFSVSVCTLLYICFSNLNNCVTYLLNGLNKIRVQIITSVIATLLFLVLVYAVGDVFGIEGIVVSMAICYMAMALVHLYQCRLIISGRARGVWNK